MSKINTSHTTWNLVPLFKDDHDPEMETEKKRLEEETYKIINKWKDRDDYVKDPKVLKEALDEYERYCARYGTSGKLELYLHLRENQDSSDTTIKAKSNQFDDFSRKLSNEIQFFTYRISKIPESEQQKFLDAPDLKEYRHFLEKQFEQAKYLLSEAEEKILTLKQPVAINNWVRMTQTFLAKEEAEVLSEEGKPEKKSFTEIMNIANHSKNKTVRDSSLNAFNSILEKHLDVAVEEINSVLQNKMIDDSLRRTERPDTIRHLGDDIDTEVVDTLLESVSSKNDIARRYYSFKAKLFGQDKLAYNERNLDYGKIDKKYSYDESVELVYSVFLKLDSKFAEIFKRMVEAGQVDVFPHKGKRGGAFCIYHMLQLPTYVFLNHTDELSDVLTIAHEFGHAINGELMKEKQNALNYDTPMSTAEVASTFMEDFVLQELFTQADDELRLSLMAMKLNDDISTIFRQVACYKFEFDLHTNFRQKGYLAKEDIGQIFASNMNAYMGDAIDQPAWSQNWWTYWPHVRYFFYVYSYAGGLLISKSMQNSVKQDPQFIEKVKEFLSAGTSDSPKNIFMKMGVDITDKNFWNKGLTEVETLLEETEQLAKKLGKI